MLLLTQWFDPEPTFKGMLFARKLRDLGFEVRVLTGFPNYPGGKLYEGYRIRLFQREVVDGIPILRVPLYPSHDNSGIRRAFNYLSFAVTASIAVLGVRRPDVAYVYHPPASIGLPARVLKLVRGVPYVYDVQDLWPDTLGATGMVRSPTALRIVAVAMSNIYRGASKLVVLSEGFRRTIAARGIPQERIDVIPNWADEAQIVPASTGPKLAGEPFTVTFAGNIGHGQGLETVLEAAELLARDGNVTFRIVGGGVELPALRELALSRKLTNVEFLPRRPLSEIGEVLSSSDALLVHLRDDPLFAITVPSKTQAYLMVGRPILMGVRGDAADLVKHAKAGIAFEPENAASLADAVKALTRLDPEERSTMGAAGREFYAQELSLDVGAARFSRVLEEESFLRPRFLTMKRLFDISISSIGLIIAAIPMAIIALVVKLRIGSPVIFKQPRPGRDNVPFVLLKFRTMTEKTDTDGSMLPDNLRLTRLGSFLRSSSLDELPELWNVLRGQMSLVGPRPLLLRYTPHFTQQERLRLRVRPGITGLAQVNGRNTLSWDDRLALDISYVKNLSVIQDLKILWLTVGNVFGRHGVVVDAESVMQNLDDERRTVV